MTYITGLSFRLDDDFIEGYKDAPVNWGYGVISELVFLRTYSRSKDIRTGSSWPFDTDNLEDFQYGGKERWYEACRRVIEGMYSIQKDHMAANKLPWDEGKAQQSAKEAYDRMFKFKWTPAGRGLSAMGTYLVNGRKDSSPLYNCFFVSTDNGKDDWTEPFTFLMEASMMGGGVGFDVRGEGKTILEPRGSKSIPYRIPDSRQGWVKSVELVLKSFTGGPIPIFDYSGIRPEGSPIITFGGIAPGPEPLRKLHKDLTTLLKTHVQDGPQSISKRLIVDIMNLIGVAVVSGNVRRSSEIAFSDYGDEEFMYMKDYTREENKYRAGHGWMSNNTLMVRDTDEVDYNAIAEKITDGHDRMDKGSGEPGLFFIDVARRYGRLADPARNDDLDIGGSNPCGEIGLESYEACNLSEIFVMRAEGQSDFHRTQKFAYLYNKTVTLLPTLWKKTNAVQMRNRRIGQSVTGTAHFVDRFGYAVLKDWLDNGYETVRRWDKIYSRWLCVRESIRLTTSKPSGTVSLLAGTTAGVHWPKNETYLRRINIPKDSPLVQPLIDAGHFVEPSVYTPDSTLVVAMPLKVHGARADADVSVFEKISLVGLIQQWWADNMVSNTITYDPYVEVNDLAHSLKMWEGKLKSISALPLNVQSYAQLPEEPITEEAYDELVGGITDADFSAVYDGYEVADDAVKQLGCDTDSCEVSFAESTVNT
jgi:adenosylcobalamin-dependent ribonucleoside-triphosphate reductase